MCMLHYKVRDVVLPPFERFPLSFLYSLGRPMYFFQELLGIFTFFARTSLLVSPQITQGLKAKFYISVIISYIKYCLVNIESFYFGSVWYVRPLKMYITL